MRYIVMENINFLCFFLLFISVVKCETIHFTNSKNHLTRSKNFTTYELKVPGGSEAITIIETSGEEPIRIEKTDLYRRKEVMSSTTSKPPIDMSLLLFHKNFTSNAAVPKKMVYAPSLLNKFMNEYNSKIHDNRNDRIDIDRGDIHNYHVDDDRQGELDGQDDHFNRWNKYTSEEKHQIWTTSSSMSPKRPNHPFNDKEGWVTMEAVPWSRSQVSKWKPNMQVKPTATVSSFSVYHKGHMPSTSGFPSENSHPSKWHSYNRPHEDHRYPHKSPGYYGNSHEEDFYDNRYQSPPNRYYDNEKKTHYSEDVKLDTSSPAHDRWYDYGYRPSFDENTDRPAHDDMPDKNSYYLNNLQLSSATALSLKRRPSSAGSYLERNTSPKSDKRSSTLSNHPSTYPSRGNGEWILVSTTKGYQYPGHRVQRGMALSKPSPTEAEPPANVTFKTHKSIKLTVLPPENDPNSKTSKKLMTTSHGGMLEVESSTHTVEGDVSLMISRNRTRLATPMPLLNVDGMVNRRKHKNEGSNRVYRAVQMPTNKESNSDSSAVIAAVGAGMVPATVAMLMPLVLGRKRRDIYGGGTQSSEYRSPFFARRL